jgi:hypothetical protein
MSSDESWANPGAPLSWVSVWFVASLASGILWAITISSLTITLVPPDALFYAKALPWLYWAGIACAVVALIVVVGRLTEATEVVKLLPSVLLILFAFGTQTFVYENPLIDDAYLFAANAQAVSNLGSFSTRNLVYPSEYPGSYVLSVQFVRVTGMGIVSYIKLYPLIASALFFFLVYVFARRFAPRYAFLAPASTVGVLWFQMHASPQSLDLIEYAVLLILIVESVRPGKYRSMVLLALFLLVDLVMVASHPTTPPILIANMLAIIVAYQIWRRSGRVARAVTVSVLVITTILWVSWLSAQHGASTSFEQQVRLILTTISSFSLTPTVLRHEQAAYLTAVIVQAATVAFVFGSGLLILLLLRRSRITDRPDMPILGGTILLAVALSPGIVFVESTYSLRPYLFSLIPWGALVAMFFSLRKFSHLRWPRIAKGVKVLLILGIVFSIVTAPITRDAIDSFNYIPSVDFTSANFANNQLSGTILIMSPFGREYVLSKSLQGGTSLFGVMDDGRLFRLAGSSVLGNTTMDLNYTRMVKYHAIIFSDNAYNVFVVRQGSTTIINASANVESTTSDQFNLIFSASTSRIYVKP